jgi:hypothetical protein
MTNEIIPPMFSIHGTINYRGMRALVERCLGAGLARKRTEFDLAGPENPHVSWVTDDRIKPRNAAHAILIHARSGDDFTCRSFPEINKRSFVSYAEMDDDELEAELAKLTKAP